MVPSSRIISQHKPHSFKWAMRIKSTVASVCPIRSSTPPGFASRGNMCPGRRKSLGFAPSSTHFMAVIERSRAEMPVVVEMWSMETVNAVQWLSVLFATICVSPNLVVISLLIGIHISPFAYDAMKFTFSKVACSAAHIKSPSFSRSGSSTAIIILPSRKSATASSIVLNLKSSISYFQL